MATFPHVKITAFGTLGAAESPVEIWSCGLKAVIADAGDLNTPIAPVATDLSDIANVALGAWELFIPSKAGEAGDGSPLISADVILSGVKAAAVAVDGKDDPAIASYIADSVLVPNAIGLGEAGRTPFSVAACVTLRGVTWKRGAAAFGRTYIPVPNTVSSILGPGATLMVNGQMVHEQTGLARHFGRLIDAINGTVNTSGKKTMVANISSSTAQSGLRWQNVTVVSCDSRPDTVRRRSNKLGGNSVATVTLPVV